jgi:hypothetical protein
MKKGSTKYLFQSLFKHFIFYFGNVFNRLDLKGPKLEIFGSRVFPQIRPVCVGDLGTRRKNSKF